SAGQKRVAQDSEHPRAEICAFLKTTEAFDSFDEGFLHQIPRLLRVTAQPTSEVVQGIEQSQPQLFKFPVRKAAHAFNRLQLLRPTFYSRQAQISVADGNKRLRHWFCSPDSDTPFSSQGRQA